MSTRAHLVEPAARTAASSSGPSGARDVSFVHVGPLRLRISRQGHGPSLLLLGGLGNSLGVWDNLVRALPDFDTIAVDAPGTGSSSTPLLPLSMTELAELYAGLVRSLELDRVSVLGLSFGGAVAQQLAYQSPELVGRLVLCGTGPGIGGIPGSAAALRELAYAGAVLQRGPLTAGRTIDLRWSIRARAREFRPRAAGTVGFATLGLRLLLSACCSRRLEQPAVAGQNRGAYTRPCWRRRSRISDRERRETWAWHTRCSG